MTRCAIYARYSSDRQSENSAEDQVRDCRARADREKWEVVGVYSDLAISGADNRRPGLNSLLADAAAGAFDIVVAEALDRIARNQADTAKIYQQLCFASVRVETLSEGRIEELMVGVKGAMSALFLKDLADKIRRGQRGSIARGRIPGGLCYGYDVVRELGDDGHPITGKRRVNEAQAVVVRRIVADYANGFSPKSIAHALNAEGVPAPRGGEWRAPTIVGNRARQIGILHNPIYVGRFVYNRVRMLRDPETRNRVSRPNAADERQSLELPELRIVDDATWTRAQEARQVRASYPLTQRQRPRHLFSGLVHCGKCGGSVVVVTKARMACTRARDAGTCDNLRRIAVGELQRRVLTGLAGKLLSADAVSLLVREYHAERERLRSLDGRVRRDREKKLRATEMGIERLIAALAEGLSEVADVRHALAKRIEERDTLRTALAEDAAVPVVALEPGLVDRYRERVGELVDQLGTGAPADAAISTILRRLVERIDVEPEGDDRYAIQVTGSLAAALAVATGATPEGETQRLSRRQRSSATIYV